MNYIQKQALIHCFESSLSKNFRVLNFRVPAGYKYLKTFKQRKFPNLRCNLCVRGIFIPQVQKFSLRPEENVSCVITKTQLTSKGRNGRPAKNLLKYALSKTVVGVHVTNDIHHLVVTLLMYTLNYM